MIISVVGARPNFMKMAPIIKEINKRGIINILVHTGQHYDNNMSNVFFKELEIPIPDEFLKVGSGTHAETTAKILISFESICIKYRPNLIIVAGDVDSTLACALAAKKLNIAIAHIESGLRSFDQRMPEEVNRILIDRISDLLFITEESGIQNCINEGLSDDKLFFVGNTMIDSLKSFLSISVKNKPWEKFNLSQNNYILVTIHRPSNVDSLNRLSSIIKLLESLSKLTKIIFPVHPRTNSRINRFRKKVNSIDLIITEPMAYFEFLGLMANAKLVITDSGGIQEETTFLGVPCLTIRENTERPVTVDIGTNQIIGLDTKLAFNKAKLIIEGKGKKGRIPKYWDGKSAIKIVDIIDKYIKR